MKLHITKTIAVLMAVFMLMGTVPTAALPVLALGDTEGATSTDIFENVTLGKGTVTNTESYNATVTDPTEFEYETINGTNVPVVDSDYSPYEPYATDDEDHPFLPGGSAWINLKDIYYGAPATPNYPLTKWSANTSVVNITDTGKTYDSSIPAAGQPIYSFPDMDLITKYMWADQKQPVSKDKDGNPIWENGVLSSADNAPDYTDETADGKVNNISLVHTVTPVDSGKTAYAYNRYDAMQGKWGLTLDENVSSVTFGGVQQSHYYGQNKHFNNALLYLTDTPYLYFSTEALDTTQMAISLLIGTPVQSEVIKDNLDTSTDMRSSNVTLNKYDTNGQVSTADTAVPEYEYRWYTITDSANRPGIDPTPDDGVNETLDYSMIPNVHESSSVMENNFSDRADSSNKTLYYIANGYTAIDHESQSKTVEADLTRLDPIQYAQKDGVTDTDSLYVSGSITGCIDFTQILPLLMGTNGDTNGINRQDVMYKIAQVRVDVKTKAGATPSASRINYMYFGPGQAAVYTPQSTVGSEVNAASWQYGQREENIGDNNVNTDNHLTTTQLQANAASGYTSGWENGEAVTIINTPNDPQTMVIDINGTGNGELITYDEYEDETGKVFIKGSTTGDGMIWKYTALDENGNEEIRYLEAEKGGSGDNNYYVMVTIPIRKWVNVFGDSRKMSFTLEYQRNGGSDKNPGFCLWGNDDGSLGNGHSQTGTRFHNEDMLMVFGTESVKDGKIIKPYYQVDNGMAYSMALIDDSIGQSTIYNGVATRTLYWHNSNYPTNNTVYSGTFEVYQKDGKTYYICKTVSSGTNDRVQVGGVYTIEHEKYTDGTLKYTYPAKGKDAYFYNAETNVLKDANGYEQNKVTLDVLSPLYNFTVASGVSKSELESTSGASDYRVYDSQESWYDMLRSPYMFSANAVLTTNHTGAGLDESHIGYVFVTALRAAMPVGALDGGKGSKVVIKNMKGDGNSAGMNMYSSAGSVVSAYDGGTGSQPEVDTKSDAPVPDLKGYDGSAFRHNSPAATTWPPSGDHYYGNGAYNYNDYVTDSDGKYIWGGVQGTQSPEAAAYGPYLHSSNYTIHDMLDTEDLFASATTQKVIGVPYTANSTGLTYSGTTYNAIIYDYPYGYRYDRGITGSSWTFSDATGTKTTTKLGTVADGTTVVVYGTIKTTGVTYVGGTKQFSDATWGLIGYESNYGWVVLDHYKTDGSTHNYQFKIVDGFTTSGLAFTEEFALASVNIDTEIDTCLAKLKDEWVYSNFTDSRAVQVQECYSTSKGVPRLISSHLGSKSHTDTYYTTNTLDGLKGNVVERKLNTSIMELGFKNRSDGDWRTIAMSRAFSKPIQLQIQKNGSEHTYPVLYYDFSDWTLSSGGAGYLIMSLVIGNDQGTTNLYYLNSSSKTLTSYDKGNISFSDDAYGYVSLESIMTDDLGYSINDDGDPTGNKIYIKAINIMYSVGPTGVDPKDETKTPQANTNGSLELRRFEIWQDGTEYLDVLRVVTDNNYNTADNKDRTEMNGKIADGFNILNDAFFYYHNEGADGVSFVKTKSNRGWRPTLTVSGVNNNENVNEPGTFEKDGIYQYRTSLGHLRVWVPGKKDNTNGTAELALQADRSFSTQNYKYLYYSYSMRDVYTGIGTMENNATNTRGVSVAIKSETTECSNAYLQKAGTWVYYSEDTPYKGTVNGIALDEREFTTSVTVALDLSSLRAIDSINQLIFYMQNDTAAEAEFYINYVYLSNVEPNTASQTVLSRPQTQYYYLMDDTGDRYSARFPTLDNPTGQVTGLNTNQNRVNPIKVTRGDHFYEGTYFNGEALSSFTNYDNNKYNAANSDDYLRYIWFYGGTNNTEDTNDILDFYTYKDSKTDNDEVGNEYDMLWSYGRWNTGEGEASRNTMYIAGADTPAEKKNYIYGNLLRRYATENYVLLRAGIEPRKYTTYFDADGGEFIYEKSTDEVKNLQQVTENNFYITTNTVLGYFEHPSASSAMLSGGYEECLRKPGYEFLYWAHYTDYQTIDPTFNGTYKEEDVSGLSEEQKLAGARFRTYIQKGKPGTDYFRAVWAKVDEDLEYTATFYYNAEKTGGSFRTLTLGKEIEDWIKKDDILGNISQKQRFILTMPNESILVIDGQRQQIYGWQAMDSDGNLSTTVFSPGQKIYLLDNTEFVPVTDASIAKHYEISLKDAKLYVKTDQNKEHPIEQYLIPITDSNGNLKDSVITDSDGYITYYGVPENYVVVAKPDEALAGHGWTRVFDPDHEKAVVKNAVTILSDNSERYEFIANQDVKICYDPTVGGVLTEDAKDENTEKSFYHKQDYNFVSTSYDRSMDKGEGNNYAVYFSSHYELGEGCEFVAAGTMITKSSYYDNYASADESMRLYEPEGGITPEMITNRTYQPVDPKGIKLVQATSVSSTEEYTAYIAHTKPLEEITYYARAYLIYKDKNDEICVAYSDVVAYGIGYKYTSAASA